MNSITKPDLTRAKNGYVSLTEELTASTKSAHEVPKFIRFNSLIYIFPVTKTSKYKKWKGQSSKKNRKEKEKHGNHKGKNMATCESPWSSIGIARDELLLSHFIYLIVYI